VKIRRASNTACARGHRWDEETTYMKVVCRECNREHQEEYRERQQQIAAAANSISKGRTR
jgi:hypothetical protein